MCYMPLMQAKRVQLPPTLLLTEHRVSCYFPFQYFGVDYTGPLYVRDNYSKSAELFKAYSYLYTRIYLRYYTIYTSGISY